MDAGPRIGVVRCVARGCSTIWATCCCVLNHHFACHHRIHAYYAGQSIRGSVADRASHGQCPAVPSLSSQATGGRCQEFSNSRSRLPAGSLPFLKRIDVFFVVLVVLTACRCNIMSSVILSDVSHDVAPDRQALAELKRQKHLERQARIRARAPRCSDCGQVGHMSNKNPRCAKNPANKGKHIPGADQASSPTEAGAGHRKRSADNANGGNEADVPAPAKRARKFKGVCMCSVVCGNTVECFGD